MKYYRAIEGKHVLDNPLVCETSNFSKYNNFGAAKFRVERYFYQGKVIKDWPSDIYMSTDKEKNDGTPDDVLRNSYMIPVFSVRVINALTECGIEGFQYLPVTIYGYNMKKKYKYYIANCINAVTALDFDKSIYHRFPDDFVNPDARGKIVCQKFVLNADCINNVDVFRISEQLSALFVSEKVVKIFNKNKFTGYSFIGIELV